MWYTSTIIPKIDITLLVGYTRGKIKLNYSRGVGAKDIRFIIDDNDCWICTSHARKNFGYPVIKIKGVQMSLSRFLYTQLRKRIPEGLLVRHKCDNPHCINPTHLELGTVQDNVKDRGVRGRTARNCGESNGRAKLTEEDVIEIKTALINGTATPNDLAQYFNVAKGAISRIKRGARWGHILPELTPAKDIRHKLSSTDVRRIKVLLKQGRKLIELAHKFKVCTSTISAIKVGKIWKDIK